MISKEEIIQNWKEISNDKPLSVENIKEYLMDIFNRRDIKTPISIQLHKEKALAMAHLVNDKELIQLIANLPPDQEFITIKIK